MTSLSAPSVLLVTGAYYPEISAAGVQCRAVAAALKGRVRFGVLTTAVDSTLPSAGTVDDVPVHRIAVDVRSHWSMPGTMLRFVTRMLGLQRGFDLVHVHGFSKKNVPVMLLPRLAGKPVLLTLHTAGQDEPDVIRRRGILADMALRSANLVAAVSPNLARAYLDAGLSPERLRAMPNGIDTTRFRPAGADERSSIRRRLGLPEDIPVVLFVGFFSRDKRPDLLFRAWRRLRVERGLQTALVFVGATASSYYEIDPAMAREIRELAAAEPFAAAVRFVEPTNAIEQYFQSASLFALTSEREANPLALMEAMACGLPCVAPRLPGATDAIIEDGVNGRLFPVDDEHALSDAIAELLCDQPRAEAIGVRARATIEQKFSVERTADAWLAAYRELLRDRHRRASDRSERPTL
jgi:glycosyltransferase involved in cell wall biosynthesis